MEVLLDIEVGQTARKAVNSYKPKFITGHGKPSNRDDFQTLHELPTARGAAWNLGFQRNRVNLHRKYD